MIRNGHPHPHILYEALIAATKEQNMLIVCRAVLSDCLHIQSLSPFHSLLILSSIPLPSPTVAVFNIGLTTCSPPCTPNLCVRCLCGPIKLISTLSSRAIPLNWCLQMSEKVSTRFSLLFIYVFCFRPLLFRSALTIQCYCSTAL